MSKGRVIGIDLGTTNSVVSVMENGQPVVMTETTEFVVPRSIPMTLPLLIYSVLPTAVTIVS